MFPVPLLLASTPMVPALIVPVELMEMLPVVDDVVTALIPTALAVTLAALTETPPVEELKA